MLGDDTASLGARTMARLDDIAICSEPGPGVTRLPFTTEHRRAIEMLGEWMREANLAVHLDAAGTLIGRREGPAGAGTLLIGSHQDSIRNGGRYDGILGVILPLTVLDALKDRELPYSIELLAFADEEGVRFPTALMGPRTLAGTFERRALDCLDAAGVSLGQALREFGCDPEALAALGRDPGGLLGYLELHIEQGPVLEAEDLPVGVVTAICGIERWSVSIEGKAAHAGTTPMHLRADAVTAAAEVALAVESVCRETEGLVGVVGSLTVTPNVVNAIPGKVDLTIELRAADDGVRARARQALSQRISATAASRSIGISIDYSYMQPGVHCDPALTGLLSEAISDCRLRPLHLMSGATHDASAMADLCPIAMMFLRCDDGLSHHPDEAVTASDVEMACQVLLQLLSRLAQRA